MIRGCRLFISLPSFPVRCLRLLLTRRNLATTRGLAAFTTTYLRNKILILTIVIEISDVISREEYSNAARANALSLAGELLEYCTEMTRNDAEVDLRHSLRVVRHPWRVISPPGHGRGDDLGVHSFRCDVDPIKCSISQPPMAQKIRKTTNRP